MNNKAKLNLFLDSSSNNVTIILFNEYKVIKSKQYIGNNNHTITIYKELEKMIKFNDFNQIKNIYFLNGPGSYTGIRVGMSIVKTICMVHNTSLYILNNLLFFKEMYKSPIAIDARGKKYYTLIDNEYRVKPLGEIGNSRVDPIINVDKFIDQKIYNKFNKVNYQDVKIDYMKGI